MFLKLITPLLQIKKKKDKVISRTLNDELKSVFKIYFLLNVVLDRYLPTLKNYLGSIMVRFQLFNRGL